MRGTRGSTSPWSAIIPKVCLVCSRGEDKNVKLQSCQSCRNASYCGKECQKKNWPAHKIRCKSSQLYLKQVQEVHGDEGVLSFHQQNRWITRISPLLKGMVAYLLNKKHDTHVIILETEHLDTKPYFRIQAYRVQSLVDMERDNPTEHLQLAPGLQEMKKAHQSRTSSDKELYDGLVVITTTNDVKLPQQIVVLSGSKGNLPRPLVTPDTIVCFINQQSNHFRATTPLISR